MPNVERKLPSILSRFFRLPIPVQLAILLAGMLTLLWSWIAFDLTQLRDRSMQHAESEGHVLARVFAQQVQSSVNAIDLTLIDLREHWQDEPDTFAETVARRQAYLERDVAFQVAVIDARGMTVFSSINPAANPVDLSDRDHFRVHRDGGGDTLFISKPMIGRISGRWTIQFTRPLLTRNGFTGVIVLSVTPEYFSRFYQTMVLGAGSSISLVRTSGDILARSPESEKALGQQVSPTLFMEAGARDTGFFVRVCEIDGVERANAWRALPSAGLVVIVGQSLDTLLAPYRQQKRVYLLGGAIVSVLLALIGSFLLADIRQRKKAAASLAESEARWKFALEGAGAGVWDWDMSSGEVQYSRRWKEMLGYAEPEIGNRPDEWHKRVHPDDITRVMADLQAHLDQKSSSYVSEYRIQAKDGSWKWFLDRGMVVSRAANGKPLRAVGTHTDISERKAAEQIIRHMALHDALTDLPNRVLCDNRLEQAIVKARREDSSLAVMFLDLDKFKPVNDTYGHAVGDVLLKEVARRVRECLRESDTLARLGGDEFVVILESIKSEENALMVAEKIRYALNQPFDVAGHTVSISSCTGIAIYPQHGQDSRTLSRNADTAMYYVKRHGRNNVLVYRPELEDDGALI